MQHIERVIVWKDVKQEAYGVGHEFLSNPGDNNYEIKADYDMLAESICASLSLATDTVRGYGGLDFTLLSSALPADSDVRNEQEQRVLNAQEWEIVLGRVRNYVRNKRK